MKLVVFSDLHVHAYRDFARVLPNGRNSRLQHTLDVLSGIREYCVANDVRHVLFGGDLFHKKGTLSVGMYQAVFEELQQFDKAQLEVVLVVGNHDQATLDGRTHAVKSFGALSRVTVVDEPTRVTLNDVSTETNIWCVPYMEDAKEFKSALRGGRFGGSRWADILLAHGGLNGAVSGPIEYRPEHELDVGDVPDGYGFRFFGHYHKRQKMAERCWYIGSPLQHSRGEAAEKEKGFLVFDTETRKFRNVPLGKPEFVSFRYPLTSEELAEVVGNFVDVEVNPDGYDLQEVVDVLLKAKAEAVNAVPILVAKTTMQRLAVNPSMSPKELVEKYVADYAPKGLDANDVIQQALGYLEGA